MLLLGSALTLLSMGGAGTGNLDQTDTDLFAASSDALVERGRYLALAGNCASCHTAENGAFMAGGLAFETPFGRT